MACPCVLLRPTCSALHVSVPSVVSVCRNGGGQRRFGDWLTPPPHLPFASDAVMSWCVWCVVSTNQGPLCTTSKCCCPKRGAARSTRSTCSWQTCRRTRPRWWWCSWARAREAPCARCVFARTQARVQAGRHVPQHCVHITNKRWCCAQRLCQCPGLLPTHTPPRLISRCALCLPSLAPHHLPSPRPALHARFAA